ncbi:MAG TPA: hypothetical protein DCG75_17445 [Bacteroidales bacterium]|nr:hypothetical protein [Bacteroidales bacterium]
MDQEFNITNWNELKIKLLKIYPHLTNADLQWRDTTKEDLLCTIANYIGISKKELNKAVEKLDLAS